MYLRKKDIMEMSNRRFHQCGCYILLTPFLIVEVVEMLGIEPKS